MYLHQLCSYSTYYLSHNEPLLDTLSSRIGAHFLGMPYLLLTFALLPRGYGVIYYVFVLTFPVPPIDCGERFYLNFMGVEA